MGPTRLNKPSVPKSVSAKTATAKTSERQPCLGSAYFCKHSNYTVHSAGGRRSLLDSYA